MSLLLLFQPGRSSTPTPTPATTPEPAYEAKGAGGAVFNQHQIQQRRLDEAEDDLIQILAIVVPLIGRH